MAPGEGQEKLRKIFDDLDANKDGTVSRAEFIKALRKGNTGVNEFFGLHTSSIHWRGQVGQTLEGSSLAVSTPHGYVFLCVFNAL